MVWARGPVTLDPNKDAASMCVQGGGGAKDRQDRQDRLRRATCCCVASRLLKATGDSKEETQVSSRDRVVREVGGAAGFQLCAEGRGFAGDRDVEVWGGRIRRKFKAGGLSCWGPFPPTGGF